MEPFVEVVASPASDRANVTLGQRLPLTRARPFRLGVQPSSEISTQMLLRGEAEFEISQRDGDWVLTTAGRGHAARLNGCELGQPVHQSLQNGDHLVFSNGLAVAFWLTGAPTSARPELADAIRNVAGPQSWLVYRDALLDDGDPFGHWMAVASSTGASDAARLRWTGSLSTAVARGLIDVDWMPHGFLDRLHLTSAAVRGPSDEVFTELDFGWFARQLSGLRAASFLRVLEADLFLGDLGRGERDAVARVDALIENIARADFRLTLEKLRLGFIDVRGSGPQLEQALARLHEICPRLDATLLLVRGRRARLTVEAAPPGTEIQGLPVGASRDLGDVEVIGASSAATLRVLGGDEMADCVVSAPHQFGETRVCQWHVSTRRADRSQPTLVNGRWRSEWVLRPGDVIEPVTGLRLRFVWV